MDDIDQQELEQIKIFFRESALDNTDKVAEIIELFPSLRPEEFEDNMNTVLRIVHTLKGDAGTVGFNGIMKLAHAIEDSLELVNKDKSELTDELVTKILVAVSKAQEILMNDDDDDVLVKYVEDLAGETTPIKKDEDITENDLFAEKKTSDNSEKNEGPAKKEKTVKLDASRLDHLMSFSGELLVTHNRAVLNQGLLEDFFKKLQKLSKENEGYGEEFDEIARQLRVIVQKHRQERLDFGYLSSEINNAMKQARMTPLKSAESTWRRIVRDASLTSKKQVVMTVEVGDIEADKYILDNLQDPIMHLLRNAVVHGIEDPAIRKAKGKHQKGMLIIKASLAGPMVKLEVSDDGQGIDPAKVGEQAVKNGLISRNKLGSMTQDEKLAMVFHSGLSTAEKVDHLCGRGVGMDVVRDRVESLGGRVEISAGIGGTGTTVSLLVPMSILSTTGLVVRNNGNTYALSIDFVECTLRAKLEEVKSLDGKPAIKLSNGEPLRLMQLSNLMYETGKTPEGQFLKVVVLKRSDVKLGLIVDDIAGEQEYVIKGLPWNFKNLPGVNGVIIQGDGTLTVSVDVPYLFEAARESEWSGRTSQTDFANGTKKTIKVLVVDDSLTSRVLESEILKSAGYDVSLASNGRQAWDMMLKKSFDMIVSDVNMPELDGLGLTRKIRSSSEFKELPVILMTSLKSPEDISAGAEAGADEYVVKGSFERDELLKIIKKYIGT